MESNRKEQIVDMINKSQAGLDTYMPYFKEYYMAYKALLDPKALKYLEESGKSNLPVYYIMSKLQRVRADFIEAYFTNKQFAKINEKKTLINASYYNPVVGEFVPYQGKSFNHHAVKMLQNAVDFYTTEDESCNLFIELVKAFDQLLTYGTTSIKCWWDGGIRVETIDINKIKYDPGASNADTNKYKVHDIEKTVDEIKDLQEQGIFDTDVDLTKIAPDYKTNPHKRIILQDVYEMKRDGLYVTTMANKDVILRDEVLIPVSDPITTGTIKQQMIDPEGDDDAVRSYGDSLIAPIIPIQREMMIMKNQQLDIVDRELNPRYISNDKNLNPFDFFNQKQRLIRGNPEQTKELPTPNLRNSNFNYDRLSTEGQEAFGVTDYNSGTSNNKQMNDTATGISILTSESNKILSYYLRCCNETLIKPLFKKITELVWMYGDAKFFYGIDRQQEIEYQVGVDVGLGATNPQMQLNSTGQAYEGIMTLAEKMQDPMRMQKAEKFYYKELLPLLGIENFEEYYNENEFGANAEEFGSPTGDGDMDIPSELLGTATKGPSASSVAPGYGS